MHAALRSLSTEYRSVLALTYTHELSAADIAVIEACSVDAVKTRLHRARQRLRRALAGFSQVLIYFFGIWLATSTG